MASFFKLLPLVLQVLGAVLKWYGAGEDVMEKFVALVNSTYESGLIPVQARDKFLDQKQRIEAKIKEREQATKPV